MWLGGKSHAVWEGCHDSCDDGEYHIARRPVDRPLLIRKVIPRQERLSGRHEEEGNYARGCETRMDPCRYRRR